MAKEAIQRKWMEIGPTQHRVKCFFLKEKELGNFITHLEGLEGVDRVTTEDFAHGIVLVADLNPEHVAQTVVSQINRLVVAWSAKKKIQLGD